MFPTQPGNTYIPSWEARPEPLTIEYVRAHGQVVMVDEEYTRALVEVRNGLVVSFVTVTLTAEGKIDKFVPFQCGRRINKYVKATPQEAKVMRDPVMCPIRPLADRVVVKVEPRTSRVTLGTPPERGIVLAVGVHGKNRDILVFNYPAGNEYAREQQEANARKIAGHFAMVVPRHPTGNWPGVEAVRGESLTPLKVGDVVLFPQGTGTEYEVDGETYMILREDDLLAVVVPKESK